MESGTTGAVRVAATGSTWPAAGVAGCAAAGAAASTARKKVRERIVISLLW
jgi:hypothetical protein